MKTIMIAAAAMCVSTLTHGADATSDAIETLRSVKDFSEGAADARTAQQQLVAGRASNLIPVLQGFKGSTRLASNYLRNAFETIAQNEIKGGRKLPADELLAFIRQTDESPAARRLAYEWLLKQQPNLEESLIPQMLTDPSPDFRRDAVTRLIEQAKEAEGQAAVALFQKALTGAVHEDQVKTISKALNDADIEVDILRHFGFLADWKIIGPFDNIDMKGYPIAYPPEKKIDLSAEYDGQLDKVTWQSISSEDDYGLINIGEQIENYKGSLMYATTTYNSSKDQAVEFRLGTPNAWKLWVNDELVFQREEYHRGTRMDQYRVPVKLTSGPNTILIKVCQNEQTQDWAQRYQFQLRVCDSTGSAVPPASQTATATTAGKESR